MRDLKFRAWNKKLKKFEQAWLNFNGEAHFVVDSYYGRKERFQDSCADGEMLTMTEDLIVEQFIDLKDKNDKEIYGGDIVRGRHDCGECTYIEVEAAVQFDDGCFKIDGIPIFMLKKLEIIGNIHENPELLKDTEAD